MEENRIEGHAADRLKALGVTLVYLFGSVAEGISHDLSDIDLGIVVQDPKMLDEHSFELYNELYDILTEVLHGGELDIVFLQAAGLEVCFDAIGHGRILFATSSDARYAFEERTMILYADFKPVLDDFNEAVLERI